MCPQNGQTHTHTHTHINTSAYIRTHAHSKKSGTERPTHQQSPAGAPSSSRRQCMGCHALAAPVCVCVCVCFVCALVNTSMDT